MMLGKKFSVACISLLMVLALAGCGKTGESEAEKLVKEACKIPDSYKKVDYQVDDKNGISYLDFKAKNMLGMEIPGRAYFKITKDRIVGNDNFFSWKMVAKDSIKANDIIKKYNDAYKTAPEIVKKYFSEPMQYFKINLTGSYMGGWSANAERTDEYPEQ